MRSLAPSTRSAYETAWSNFEAFARAASTTTQVIDPCNPTATDILYYITYESQFNTAATVCHYLSGIKHYVLARGGGKGWPSSWLLDQAMRGLRKGMATLDPSSSSAGERAPLTPLTLARLKPYVDFGNHDDRLVWAVAVVGVYCLLRVGELTVRGSGSEVLLRRKDWTPHADGGSLFLRKSKTDQEGLGATVRYFGNDSASDPVDAMGTYAELCPWADGGRDGLDGPLFAKANGQPLDRGAFVARLRGLAEAAGLGREVFNGISLRRGGATALASAGVGLESIMKMGRWRSLAFERYIVPPVADLRRYGEAMSRR